MYPFAYGLREHQIFKEPVQIDLDELIEGHAPGNWPGVFAGLDSRPGGNPLRHARLSEEQDGKVTYLPLVNCMTAKSSVSAVTGKWRAGWSTHADDFAIFPEIELLSGGLNTQTPTAAALWRQGNLLHFGFELSPAQMNETGQALLLNSIAYISRFTEDRPIAITPSVFAGEPVPRWRGSVAMIIRDQTRSLDDLPRFVTPATFAELKTKERAGAREWLERYGPYLYPEHEGRLAVDRQAVEFGVPFGELRFLDAAAAALREGGARAELARNLVRRYVPGAPDTSGPLRAWVDENRGYLFFSDSGEHRWYIDPLAKKRGVPSAELRGPLRASVH